MKKLFGRLDGRSALYACHLISRDILHSVAAAPAPFNQEKY